MTYVGPYHKLVASVDLGIYNWKQHSTGFLLKKLREQFCNNYAYEWEIIKLHNSENPETLDLYWFFEWGKRLRDELAKRPHLKSHKERK